MRLWHREFWLMAVACLLLALSVTMLIPTMPLWMLYVEGLSTAETGLAMGAFALGLFLPGGLCSYLVQHYRRNLVCVWAALLLAVSVAVPYYLPVVSVLSLMLLRLVQGAAFGLAQMVLSSTLIIDTCDSFQRTEGNHSATWFGRFALSLGPLAGLLLYQAWGFPVVSVAAAGCALLSAVLVLPRTGRQGSALEPRPFLPDPGQAPVPQPAAGHRGHRHAALDAPRCPVLRTAYGGLPTGLAGPALRVSRC